MAELKASYTSPSQHSPHTISASLPALSSSSTIEERTAYLGKLHASVVNLQNDINTFLTRKMEADKIAGSAKVDDAKEEENYGEEVVEGD